MTPATMKRSNRDEPATTPLPPASPQSILKLLSRSSSLFPKASPYPRGTTPTPILTTASPVDRATSSPYPVPALSSDYNFRGIKAADHEKNATKKSPALPSASGRLRPTSASNANDANGASDKRKKWVRFQSDAAPFLTQKVERKKSVRFQSDVTLYGLNDTPRASDASSEAKQTLWYGAADFDRFKHDAAVDAGVKIMRHSKKETAKESCGYVMAGDFDGKLHSAAGADGNGSAASNGTPAEGARYNENKYDDSRDDRTGEIVCRRGLGHHFSRARRKSRAVARSVVAEMQQSLLASAGEEPDRRERARLVLALVAARCSRTAREEARWRGDVDYRVAHPERHVDAEAPLEKTLARAESSDGGPAERAAGKRDRAPDIVESCDGAGRKRRRTAGGCRDAVGGGDYRDLSPAPVVFAGGTRRVSMERHPDA